MLIFKRAVGMALVIVGFLFLNAVLCVAMLPCPGPSELMWDELKKEEELDIVYVGSSLCQRSFNPYIIDEIMGTKSFNMGTPSQSLSSSLIAIKAAIEDHQAKQIVLTLGYFSLYDEGVPQAEFAFLKAKNDNIGKTIFQFSASEENFENARSVSAFFPWTISHVAFRPQAILENIKDKINGKTALEDVMVNNEYRHYIGKGYGELWGIIDYDNITDFSKNKYSGEINEERIQELREICVYCKRQNVDLIVITTPYPDFDILESGEDYFETHALVKNVLNEQGVEYYNYSLIKDEFFDAKEDYFFDFEHLNAAGGDAFSRSFCEFIRRRNSGEDMEEHFYSPQEYLSSVKRAKNDLRYMEWAIEERGAL